MMTFGIHMWECFLLISEILSVGLNSLCDYLPFYVHRALAHTLVDKVIFFGARCQISTPIACNDSQNSRAILQVLK